ncbi:phage major capsid protein, P2 family [Halomonas pacifica]|uniref:phage major capsid protein, P2 family n=1 Tax=Bisbaumannia pacifica TaxID=77098 RepID=UPI0023587DC1|nr:phage major capsid protein, P2 family [Halomonas pacifica]MDC8802421.1 phage major capsid protein, P2 family [Halomonas pacifica]
MQNHTRQKFNKLLSRVAELSGVPDSTQSFTVEPSVQQRLEDKIQESSAFLSQVNIVGVDDLKGQRLGINMSGPIAKRTDTNQHDREPRDIAELDEYGYSCESTEFDTHMPWSKVDAWAKFPDFQIRVANMISQQQALDRLTIGFNGISVASETDRVANPLLEDVNKGWLQQYREQAPARVLTEGSTTGEVRVGPGGDYENIDALIFDATNEMIDPWHRESRELRVIAGRRLIADKYFQIAQQHGDTPSEMLALDMVVSSARFGRLPAIRVPKMPETSLFITPPSNLSIYWQRGSRRRYIVDNPRRKRVEDYQSSNDAYVIEDFGAGCLIENVMFGDWA